MNTTTPISTPPSLSPGVKAASGTIPPLFGVITLISLLWFIIFTLTQKSVLLRTVPSRIIFLQSLVDLSLGFIQIIDVGLQNCKIEIVANALLVASTLGCLIMAFHSFLTIVIFTLYMKKTKLQISDLGNKAFKVYVAIEIIMFLGLTIAGYTIPIDFETAVEIDICFSIIGGGKVDLFFMLGFWLCLIVFSAIILGIVTISLIIYQTRIKSQPSGGKRKKNSFKIYRSLLSIFILVGVIRLPICIRYLLSVTNVELTQAAVNYYEVSGWFAIIQGFCIVIVWCSNQRIWGGFLYKITCSNPSYEHLYEKMKRVHGITKAATFTNRSGGSSSKNEGSGNSKNSRNIISVETQS